jgi:2-oxo-3-hexenedioate decarboxylase
MNSPRLALKSQDIATEVVAALGKKVPVAPFSLRTEGFDLEAAYSVTAEVRALRIARGEQPIGRKIGFTNRTIWAEYGVWAPIWGYVYDSTVRNLPTGSGELSLATLAEPRIEPEIVFGLRTAPAPGMDDAALLDCIEWVAHGFEIVQSIYPAWKFSAADTIAAFGLHGALLIGPRHEVASRRDQWLSTLGSFDIDLLCDGAVADRGRSSNVLDGPLSTLRHVVAVLARDAGNPPLAAGEIVTTGTLTRALPISPGQTWTTALRGVALPGLNVRFS